MKAVKAHFNSMSVYINCTQIGQEQSQHIRFKNKPKKTPQSSPTQALCKYLFQCNSLSVVFWWGGVLFWWVFLLCSLFYCCAVCFCFFCFFVFPQHLFQKKKKKSELLVMTSLLLSTKWLPSNLNRPDSGSVLQIR